MDTKSLGLPSGSGPIGERVDVVYAPEAKQPSPLLVVRIEGTQRCQVICWKFGMEVELRIARTLFDEYVAGAVAKEDLYARRNTLLEQVAQGVLPSAAGAKDKKTKGKGKGPEKLAANIADLQEIHENAEKRERQDRREELLEYGTKAADGIDETAPTDDDADNEDEGAEEEADEESEDELASSDED